MRVLDPALDAVLNTLGSSEIDKAILVGFLENQVASATGRMNGLASSINDLARQRDAQLADVDRLIIMLNKLTVEKE